MVDDVAYVTAPDTDGVDYSASPGTAGTAGAQAGGGDVYAALYSQGAVNPLASNYIHVSAEEPAVPSSGGGGYVRDAPCVAV